MMRHFAMTVLFIRFFQIASAVKCIEEIDDGFTEADKCMGDMCWLQYHQTDEGTTLKECLVGISFTAGCYKDPLNVVICFCNHTDYCNENLPTWKTKEVKGVSMEVATLAEKTFPYDPIYERFNGMTFYSNIIKGTPFFVRPEGPFDQPGMPVTSLIPACEVYASERFDEHYSNISIKRNMRLYSMLSFEDSIWTNSLPYFNGGVYGLQTDFADSRDIYSACNWDYCNTVSLDAQYDQLVNCTIMLFENEKTTTGTCTGQSCYLMINDEWSQILKGCFWQDWSKAEGRFEIGRTSITPEADIYLCAENYCNNDKATALDSIKNCPPNYPPFGTFNKTRTWNDVMEQINAKDSKYSLTCSRDKTIKGATTQKAATTTISMPKTTTALIKTTTTIPKTTTIPTTTTTTTVKTTTIAIETTTSTQSQIGYNYLILSLIFALMFP